ncbi:MAG: ABC transporter permease [Betaproteobacteria bacterium]|jgi:peptide/nickel transport system permease protein|nr:peptide ABC transporter permease [Betaproteobacteria bacterium UKL13-2]
MGAYILRRIGQMVPTLAGVMLLIFVLFNAVGGDPALVLAGKITNKEQIENIRKQLGVDQPWYVQMGYFGFEVATGFTCTWRSFTEKPEPPKSDPKADTKAAPKAAPPSGCQAVRSWATNEEVPKILATRIGPTLSIMIPVLVLETIIAIFLAIGVAYVRGTLTDRMIMMICTVAMSISFLVYIIVAQYYFGFKWGVFPVQGWSDNFWKNMVTYAPLPIMLAIFVGLAPALRLYRSFFLDEINSDYVRTARAKGLSENKVLLKHVMRNAMIPIITNVGIAIPSLFVGSFLLESFFSIPGLGREILVAVNRSDFPVIKAATVYLAMITMIINLLVDITYKAIDPRVTFK